MPDYETIMLPLLQLAAEANGQEVALPTAVGNLADQFDLTDDEVPFYKLRLIDQKETFRVHEVVVGPTPNPQQSKMSVSGFLVRNGFKAPVELSMVPYRNW